MTGSVKVIAFGPIGGVLRFDLPEMSMAGVGASPPVRDALFPVRRQEGGINTGVAIHNLGEEAMGVTCRLMSGGVVLEEVAGDDRFPGGRLLRTDGRQRRYSLKGPDREGKHGRQTPMGMASPPIWCS